MTALLFKNWGFPHKVFKGVQTFESKKRRETAGDKGRKKGGHKAFGKEQKNGVTVTVTYNKPVWTEADIDGKRVETATVSAGSTRTYNGKSTVKLSFGSIRDVSIKVNGKEL